MASERIAYTAYTQSCTFLLDSEGFCRRILVRSKQKNPTAARRCIGGQYVASLVLGQDGGLAEMPTVGAPLIFARIDEGRVSLVRTGPLERFVVHDDVEDRERELASLARTEERKALRPRSKPPSAPPPKENAARRRSEPEEVEGSEDDLEEADDLDVEDVVYHDAADRTQQLKHLHFEDDKTLMRKSSPPTKKKGMLPKRP